MMTDNNTNTSMKNLTEFSCFLGQEYQIPPTVFFEYILCGISLSLAQIKGNHHKEEIIQLYDANSLYYDEKLSVCDFCESILLQKVPLETEACARKILGLSLASEEDPILRRNFIQIISILYPHLYRTVKRHNFKHLLLVYDKPETFLSSETAFYERAVFLYLTFYCSPDWVDPETLYVIAQNIYETARFHPLHADIEYELLQDKEAITILKKEIEDSLGTSFLPSSILLNETSIIKGVNQIFKNLFYINKLDYQDFSVSISEESLNKLFLAFIKQNIHSFTTEQKLVLITASLYLESIVEEYQKAKYFFYKNNQDAYKHKLIKVSKEKQLLENKTNQLQTEVSNLKQKLSLQQEREQNSLNSIKKQYDTDLAERNRMIQSLQKQLNEEKSYRQELNKLREYIFSLDIPIFVESANAISLKERLGTKKIIVVGGPRQWRRKLRESFPFIDTLSGTSTNFDLSPFIQIDCVLFYTNYMSHSIYNKAMNYIRNHHLKFGYLKSTNIQLIEAELTEVLKQNNVIN